MILAVLAFPSLLAHGEFVTNSSEMANIFSKFFRYQYKPISNVSTPPSWYRYDTDGRLSYINFTSDEILKAIEPLDLKKLKDMMVFQWGC